MMKNDICAHRCLPARHPRQLVGRHGTCAAEARASSMTTIPAGRMLAALGVCFSMLGGCASPSRPPAPAPTRDGRWAQDVDYLADNLPRLHVNAFHSVSRARFESEIRRLRQDVPKLKDHEIIVRLMQIVASIGDGHTRLGGQTGFGALPVRLRRFEDGVFVVAATAEYAEIVGARVVHVDETPIEEALAAVSSVIPHDNCDELREAAPWYLAEPEVLLALGVARTADAVPFELEPRDGPLTTVELRRLPTVDGVRWATVPLPDGTPRPLSRRNQSKPYWFERLPEQSVLYVAYNSCVDAKEQPFAEFVESVFRIMDAESTERLVVDLRNNEGGNSEVINPLIREIRRRPHQNQRGRLFVLIGRLTYSSAMLNALDFRRETNALLVGEPTGGKPNSYGEQRSFRLPNSRLEITYATKYFRKVWFKDPPAVIPDVTVETSSADFFAGRDPVLEAVCAQER